MRLTASVRHVGSGMAHSAGASASAGGTFALLLSGRCGAEVTPSVSSSFGGEFHLPAHATRCRLCGIDSAPLNQELLLALQE